MAWITVAWLRAAHGTTDLGKAVVGQLPSEVHGDLARDGYGGAPVAGQEGSSFDPELSSGRIEDVGDSAGPWRGRPARRPSTCRARAGVGSCPRSEE